MVAQILCHLTEMYWVQSYSYPIRLKGQNKSEANFSLSRQVTLTSRGNWYYDIESRIKPHVTHLVSRPILDEGVTTSYCIVRFYRLYLR